MKTVQKTAFLLIFLFLYNCTYDSPGPNGNNILYTPFLTSSIDYGSITLKWYKPMYYDMVYIPGLIYPNADPDYFEILISTEGPDKLKHYQDVSRDIFGITIGNLSNGTPYYFAVKACAVGMASTQSNVIMAIPGFQHYAMQVLPNVYNATHYGSYSVDGKQVACTVDNFRNNGNLIGESVMTFNLADQAGKLVWEEARTPDWSPNEQKIVFQASYPTPETQQILRADYLIEYDLTDNSYIRLAGDGHINFMPVWSPDGKWIAYLSDAASGNEYNIWKIPSDSGKAIQVTHDFNDPEAQDLGIIDDRSPNDLAWSPDGKYLAFDKKTKTGYNYQNDIYAVPVNGGERISLVTSPWEDKCPAYSRDGSKIAFLSDRSGYFQIWTLNLKTGNLQQLTSNLDLDSYVGFLRLEWDPTDSKILFTGYFNGGRCLYTIDL